MDKRAPHPVVEQAAAWLVRLQADPDGRALREWKRWYEADPEHAAVWERFAALHESLPDGRRARDRAAAQAVQAGASLHARRRSLKFLLAAAATGLTAAATHRYASDRGWLAEYRTETGEQRMLSVGARGVPLLLNTDTAVDIAQNGAFIDICLHAGELLLDLRAQAAPGLRVVTRDAAIEPLDARLVVRHLRGGPPRHTLVALTAGRARIVTEGGASQDVVAGQAVLARTDRVEPAGGRPERAFAWTQGMLVAEGMRLDEFLDELARYRPGFVRCDPALAGLRVTGTFRLRDTDRILAALAESLGLKVEYRTRYWVHVVAA